MCPRQQTDSAGGDTGTGIFLDAAGFLATGGGLLGDIIVSSTCVCIMSYLGALIVLLPIPGSKVTIAGHFFDPAWTFAS